MKEERFSRTELLLGANALKRLSAARVVVVGLGAVGSYAVEGLARAGVGNLRLVDFDEVRVSNINRQLYALDSTVGRSKVEVARQRVLDINPRCKVEALNLFVSAETIERVLEGKLDVVVDAIDSVGPKLLLISSAVHAGLYTISIMGAATRRDPLKIRVGDLSETTNCPLARYIRKRLHRRGVDHGVRCVYSIEPVPHGARAEAPEDEAASGSPREYERGRKRARLGSLSCLTGMFGLIAANEAIARITGPGPSPA